MTTVRETRRADELKPGDWLAGGGAGISALPAEVLHALTYPHPGAAVARTHLVLREIGVALPFTETFRADRPITLATDDDLAGYRAGAERAQRIADIRALADFLEDNPSLPAPEFTAAQGSPGCDGDVWNSGAKGIAEVRRVAEIFGEQVEEDDERTQVVKRFGDFTYTYIAWHKDGRPAEPAPEPLVIPHAHEQCETEADHAAYVVADPTGLAYSRADDAAEDPTPPGVRQPLHTGAVTDGGLVDETETCPARTTEAFTGNPIPCVLAAGHDEAHRWRNGEITGTFTDGGLVDETPAEDPFDAQNQAGRGVSW